MTTITIRAGSTQEMLHGIIESQTATNTMILKSLISHGLLHGEAVVNTLERMSQDDNVPGDIMKIVHQNVASYVLKQLDAEDEPVKLTVIDGGLED